MRAFPFELRVSIKLLHTHTHTAGLDKDNGLRNNFQSHFSFEDIYRETDHDSRNAPTNTEKTERKTIKEQTAKKRRPDGRQRQKETEKKEKTKSDIGYLAPTISSFWPGSKVSCE